MPRFLSGTHEPGTGKENLDVIGGPGLKVMVK